MNQNFWENAVQINDGLTQTAACSSAVAYDNKNGLIFVSYATGLRKAYGESAGKICLSIFPPAQPTNIRRVVLDHGIGISRGFLCNCIYMVGDGVVRVIFSTDRGEELGVYYRDYDFLNDTVSERTVVKIRTEAGDIPLNTASYLACLRENHIEFDATAAPIINKASFFDGKIYTAVTLDFISKPVLCTIENDTLVPFTVVPETVIYEFRYYRDESGFYAVYRVPKDDPKQGRCGMMTSTDGKKWNATVFADGIQSRPDIMPYYGKPLVLYNYFSDHTATNFPPMHHSRTAVKLIYDGKTRLQTYSQYGIVEPELLSIFGDLYISFSNTAQGLMIANNCGWMEEGRPVENGKERINWGKIGYIL